MNNILSALSCRQRGSLGKNKEKEGQNQKFSVKEVNHGVKSELLAFPDLFYIKFCTMINKSLICDKRGWEMPKWGLILAYVPSHFMCLGTVHVNSLFQ